MNIEVDDQVVGDGVTDDTAAVQAVIDSDAKKDKPDPEADKEPGDGKLSDEDEVIVTIGDEELPKEDEEEKTAPEWVRELRKSQRETARENRELKAKLATKEKVETKPTTLGEKPKLADPDIDYDSNLYEQKLDAWNERKHQIENQATEVESAEKEQQQAWKKKLDDYSEKKSNLKVKDFDDAEEVVLEAFSQTQQGIVIQGATNSALVFYAIGKNPDQVKKLAAIKDPVKFAFAVAKLEKDLKVNKRRSPPPPESRVTSGTGPSSAMDSTLEKLRAEAVKTGNYTKVTEYKRQKRGAKT